jgi:hypothetical protein
MIPRAGGADSQFLSADELAVEAELRGYAARVSPLPSAAFMDRVMAAAERSPLPVAARGPRVRATELVHAAGRRLSVALAQVAGGPSIPLRVRVQAGAMLVVVALLITTGAALAAAGATSVATWVAGPQAPAIASQTPLLPTQRQDPSAALTTDQPHRTGHPNGSNNPGNGGRPTQSPGSRASNHPNGSNNPGNGGRPSERPGPTAAARP